MHEPDDIPSGDQFASQGRLDDACDVYRRCIKNRRARLTGGRFSLQASEEQVAIDRISDIAFRFILGREFEKVLALA